MNGQYFEMMRKPGFESCGKFYNMNQNHYSLKYIEVLKKLLAEIRATAQTQL